MQVLTYSTNAMMRFVLPEVARRVETLTADNDGTLHLVDAAYTPIALWRRLHERGHLPEGNIVLITGSEEGAPLQACPAPHVSIREEYDVLCEKIAASVSRAPLS